MLRCSSRHIADRWFPLPQRLETAPGHHRFIWNLAWGTSGVAESDEPDDGEGTIPRGPKAAPGIYTVELSVDGKPLPTATLLIEKDPRSAATPDEFQNIFETSYCIFSGSLESRRVLAEIESVKKQLTQQASPGASITGHIPGQAKALLASIESITSGSSSSPEVFGLEQANTELTSVLNVSESSDRPIPSQALEVYGQAQLASNAGVKAWAVLKQGPLATYNKQLLAAHVAPIAISAIEQEVYLLMTQ